MTAQEYRTDVVVVGSGSAALTAAIAASSEGLEPLVLESTDVVGGSSAMSGGGLWIPNNPLMREAGVFDSQENARTYLDDVIADVGPVSSPERREAFLREGPRMVSWLRELGFRFIYGRGYPDYYPERSGGSVEGRAVEGASFDLKKLGPWQGRLRVPMPMPMHTTDASQFAVSLRTAKGFATAANVIGVRAVGGRLIGKHLAGMGGSLIGQLLHLCLARSIPVWLESPMAELLVEDGAVVGVIADHNGNKVRIRANRGVVLAAGGFPHNQEMRERYHPAPITTEWTSASPGNVGTAIQAGMDVGAATALMDEAWWGPAFINHKGEASFLLWERSLPYGFIVDSSGQRFMNESASYVDCGHWQYERNQTVPAIPAYLIIDARHRRYYPFGMMLPGITPKAAIRSGAILKADTLEGLAGKAGIDAGGLQRTAERFNSFAERGKDEDFHRGDSAYDRFYSDPRVKPNPNLGPVERAPFYAVKVWPGDLGTKGGLLTDEHARVLRDDGEAIPGLYASGNTSASVMGRTYPGPGSTIGPAMTFGMIAGRHLAEG